MHCCKPLSNYELRLGWKRRTPAVLDSISLALEHRAHFLPPTQHRFPLSPLSPYLRCVNQAALGQACRAAYVLTGCGTGSIGRMRGRRTANGYAQVLCDSPVTSALSTEVSSACGRIFHRRSLIHVHVRTSTSTHKHTHPITDVDTQTCTLIHTHRHEHTRKRTYTHIAYLHFLKIPSKDEILVQIDQTSLHEEDVRMTSVGFTFCGRSEGADSIFYPHAST